MFAFSLRASLTRQIEEKYEEVKEREHTSRKKKSWCEDIERIIKQSYPTSQLILVGSSANSFATEGCDVDLTLIRPNTGLFYGSSSNVQVLGRIRDGLRSIPFINTELIAGAVVPILKLNDWRQGLEGDISVDIHNSIFNTYLQKCYANMDPRVTPLVVTIKHWAKVSGITCARDHKLSGFAVVLLVLYYLQRGCTPPLLPSLQAMDPSHFSTTTGASATAEKLSGSSLPFSVKTYTSHNNDTLGNLLVGFFNFYCEFDWYRVISVRLADSRNVPIDRKWTRPHIRIEDPFDCKNVTRAVYKYQQFIDIKQAIRRAKQQLANSSSRLNDIL